MNEADYRLGKYEAMDELGDQIQREHFAGVRAAAEPEPDRHLGDIAEVPENKPVASREASRPLR